jgi:hypothetical protein
VKKSEAALELRKYVIQKQQKKAAIQEDLPPHSSGCIGRGSHDSDQAYQLL